MGAERGRQISGGKAVREAPAWHGPSGPCQPPKRELPKGAVPAPEWLCVGEKEALEVVLGFQVVIDEGWSRWYYVMRNTVRGAPRIGVAQ